MVNENGEFIPLDAPCIITVADQEGSVWFVGEAGTSTLNHYEDGELQTYLLSKHVPISATVGGSQGDFVHFHGMNAIGEPAQWSIDIQANGSIESGRGFLNLLFLLAGGVLLGMMVLHGIEQLRREE